MKLFGVRVLSVPALALLILSSTAASAFAGGFALNEQSVKSLGNAFAGSSVTADDASTIFFNPAGLTRLPENSFVGSGYAIFPEVRFKNRSSTVVTGAPLSGGDGGDAGADVAVPNFYAAWGISDRIKVGIGVNVPFGLATKYSNDWVGRYHAVDSELSTININPTVAAKVNDNLSVGAGINIQYANATFD